MSKNLIVLAIVVAVILLAGWKFLNPAQEKTGNAAYKKISASEAKKMMDEGNAITILDVRTPAEFAGGHIKGAINIANETIVNTKPALLPDLDATILVYCRSGNRSAQSASKLAAMGYTQIYDFGGINSWSYGTVR